MYLLRIQSQVDCDALWEFSGTFGLRKKRKKNCKKLTLIEILVFVDAKRK